MQVKNRGSTALEALLTQHFNQSKGNRKTNTASHGKATRFLEIVICFEMNRKENKSSGLLGLVLAKHI